MRATRMDFSKENGAIVAAIDPGPTWAEVPAEIGLVERRSEAIEDRVVERAIQFTSLCRHQRTPDPEVHELIELELPDRIEQADIAVTREMISTSADCTVKTFGIECELDVLMDPAVDIDTSVVDIKLVAPG